VILVQLYHMFRNEDVAIRAQHSACCSAEAEGLAIERAFEGHEEQAETARIDLMQAQRREPR